MPRRQTLLTFKAGDTTETLILDVTTMHEPAFVSNITTHPVERGVDVADHSRPEPIRLTMEFFIVDVPGQSLEGGSLNPKTLSDRSKFTFGVLDALRIEGVLVRIDTRFRTYDNMAIKSLMPVINVDNRAGVQVKVEFQEVRVVDSKTVSIEKRKTVPKAQKQVDAGAQSAKQVKQEDKDTFLTKGKNAAANFIAPVFGR